MHQSAESTSTWVSYSDLEPKHQQIVLAQFLEELRIDNGGEPDMAQINGTIARYEFQPQSEDKVWRKVKKEFQTPFVTPSAPAPAPAIVEKIIEAPAPALPPALSEYRMIDPRKIRPGANPRTFIPPERIAELRLSMKERGYDPAYPLIVRPIGEDEFEIVAGECRWTAASAESITLLPCCVRVLSDLEALMEALRENIQHESLTPLDEALGFERAAKMGKTNEEIAIGVSKSLEFISHRRALAGIVGTAAAKALAEKMIKISHAEVLARLPKTLIDEVTDLVVRPKFGAAPMPVAELEELIKKDYQRELRGASFDPTDPTLTLVGDCSLCRFNSKNIAIAAGQKAPRIHMCTNLTCFREKEAAAYERWMKTEVAAGNVVLTPEEAANIWNYSGSQLNGNAPYVELNEPPYEHELKQPEQKAPTWKTLTDGQQIEKVFARDDQGKVHTMLRRDAAFAAAKANDHDIFKESAASKVLTGSVSYAGGGTAGAPIPSVEAAAADVDAADKAREAAEQKRLAEEEADAVWEHQVADLVRRMHDAPDFPVSVFGTVWAFLEGYFPDGVHFTAKRRGQTVELFRESTEFCGVPRIQLGALIEVMLQQTRHEEGQNADEALRRFADDYGANLKQLAKEAKKMLKAKREEAAKANSITDGMKWTIRRDKPEDFTWENRECSDPDICELAMPAESPVNMSVRVARGDKGWYYGNWHGLKTAEGGATKAVREEPPHYGTRELAVHASLLDLLQYFDGFDNHTATCERLRAYVELITRPAKKGGK